MDKIKRFGVIVFSFLAFSLLFGFPSLGYTEDFQAQSSSTPPEPVDLMIQLKKASPKDYNTVFDGFFSEGKVRKDILNHAGLRKELRRIGEDFFYKKVIRGNYIRDDNVSGTHVDQNVIISFREYQKIVSHLDGEVGVRIWMKILPHSPASGPIADTFARKLKSHGKLFAKLYLQEVSFHPESERGKFLYLRVSNWEKLMRSLYEGVRLHWDQIQPGLRKRILRFALDALRWDQKQLLLQEQKTFAIATMYDRGFSDRQVEGKLTVPEKVQWYEGGTSPGSSFVPRLFNAAETWRSNYPNWPVK